MENAVQMPSKGPGRRPGTGRAARLAPVLIGAALLAAACGDGAVQVPVPSPTPRRAGCARGCGCPRRCTARSAATPPGLAADRGLGLPAIALRCGVPRPATLKPTSELVTINGIDWFGMPADRPVTFTAVGRQAYVEVTVPPKYNPAGDVLIELGPAIRSTIPAKPEGQI